MEKSRIAVVNSVQLPANFIARVSQKTRKIIGTYINRSRAPLIHEVS